VRPVRIDCSKTFIVFSLEVHVTTLFFCRLASHLVRKLFATYCFFRYQYDNLLFNFSESDGSCSKNLLTFKRCAETILSGLVDQLKNATATQTLPQRNKVAAVQNAKKGKSNKGQKLAKAAPKSIGKSAQKSKKN